MKKLIPLFFAAIVMLFVVGMTNEVKADAVAAVEAAVVVEADGPGACCPAKCCKPVACKKRCFAMAARFAQRKADFLKSRKNCCPVKACCPVKPCCPVEEVVVEEVKVEEVAPCAPCCKPCKPVRKAHFAKKHFRHR